MVLIPFQSGLCLRAPMSKSLFPVGSLNPFSIRAMSQRVDFRVVGGEKAVLIPFQSGLCLRERSSAKVGPKEVLIPFQSGLCLRVMK